MLFWLRRREITGPEYSGGKPAFLEGEGSMLDQNSWHETRPEEGTRQGGKEQVGGWTERASSIETGQDPDRPA